MTSAFLVSLVAVGIFAIGWHVTGLISVAHGILQRAYQGIAAMTDAALGDDEKELIIRRAGIAVCFGTWSIFWRFAACLTAAFIAIYLANRFHLANGSVVIGLMLRFDYIVLVSCALIGIVWVANRVRRSSNPREGTLPYNMGERLIHMLAFASPTLQKAAAQIDDAVFHLLNRKSEDRTPIFIMSLARGGTTALLNAFSDMPFIATHTYRDMPFITAPYLWDRLSAPFRRKVIRTKRAHGDGLEIDIDSPEAFDEVYWRLYWPEKYRKHDIAIWNHGDINDKATDRFQACFRKIAHVRGRPTAHYLSKNNANIARLRCILRAFPGALVVVPVRRPAPHAASLLRQHRNFIALQSNEDFIRRYMRDIGHLEFGLLHTPFAFDNFDHTAYSLDSSDYWLAYWIAAFREVRANLALCHIILQDDLRLNANSCIRNLLSTLGFDIGEQDFTPYFRSAPDETDVSVFSPDLLTVADSLYHEISRKAV